MSGGRLVGRSAELLVTDQFFTSVAEHPGGLVIDGEAGIGKTALWSAAVQRARESGFRVLEARASRVESVLPYGVVVQLIDDVDCETLLDVPKVRRIAMDHVLRRAEGDDTPSDQRVVAMTLLSILGRLTTKSPLLIAVDDLQWIDPSSKSVISFIARRLNRRFGMLVTEGAGHDDSEATASWLQMAGQDGLERIRLGPLHLVGLHTLISDQLGHPLPRSTTARIAEISHGNPSYALELAHSPNIQTPATEPFLPAPLAELVRDQVGTLEGAVQHVLLAAACVSDPTIDVLARATGTTAAQAVELLEPVEDKGVIAIQGNRVRFRHPLLARGVYAQATSAQRREMHRLLADVESLPERKARHLALAAVGADPATLQALDAAADAARTRGAPVAAAELVDLAIRLGGDTPERRILAAADHFRAGNAKLARAELASVVDGMPPGPVRARAANHLAEVYIYVDKLADAIELLHRAQDEAATDPTLLAQTLLLLSFAHLNAGKYGDSRHYGQRASTLADELGIPGLISQVHALRVASGLVSGEGLHEDSLQRALESEDPNGDVLLPFSASAVNVLAQAWTGRLDEAHAQILAVRKRSIERGTEIDIMFLDLRSTLIDAWRADFAAAAATAERMTARAEQLGGDRRAAIAHIARAVVAAYTGCERDARTDARAGLHVAKRCGSTQLANLALTVLGFLDVSLGNDAEALVTLQPLIARFGAQSGTEIGIAAFIPDAVEAMIAAGQLARAEPLIGALERNGRRLDRPWMLAVGARCRSMWLAAQGDVEAATRVALQAMAEHDRLPMPFERARTQLLLGQLQCRGRHREAGAASLGAALRTFERIGTPLWVKRTRDQLATTAAIPSEPPRLTPSEGCIAELAASGMTNRDVAAELSISPKTVEAGLTRVYRKLGINSRAELVQRISPLILEERATGTFGARR